MNHPDEAPHAIERLAQAVQSLAENDQMINGRLDELFGVLEQLTETTLRLAERIDADSGPQIASLGQTVDALRLGLDGALEGLRALTERVDALERGQG
jgi:ABC-type transporter Mla subunit MlaD